MPEEVKRPPSKGYMPWAYAEALERAVGEALGTRARDAGQALADAEVRLSARIAAIEERLAALEDRLAETGR